MKRILSMCLSVFFLILAGVGVLLPILPTTPFLICSGIFAAKGSKRFHQWLTSTKLYQKHASDFVERRSMTLDTKIKILVFATLLLGIGFVMSSNTIARVLIAILIIVKYYYFLFKIKTLPTPRSQVNYD